MTATIVAAAIALPMAAPPSASVNDRLIDAGGLTLHLSCDGDRPPGSPLVVLEAGAGNSADTWRAVFGPIARFARVCAYDRPGLGTSSQTVQPRLPDDIVATLHAMLSAAAERPPYVMAGHSWGGEIVRLYAMRHPAEVVGMVLIDSSHEDQLRRFAEVAPNAADGNGARPTAGPAPPPREQADLATMGAALAKNPWHANIPLVVLTRTPPGADETDPRPRVWQELQRELATRSPQAAHIVATKSGHYVQIDEPPLVIDAVRRVVAAAANLR